MIPYFYVALLRPLYRPSSAINEGYWNITLRANKSANNKTLWACIHISYLLSNACQITVPSGCEWRPNSLGRKRQHEGLQLSSLFHKQISFCIKKESAHSDCSAAHTISFIHARHAFPVVAFITGSYCKQHLNAQKELLFLADPHILMEDAWRNDPFQSLPYSYINMKILRMETNLFFGEAFLSWICKENKANNSQLHGLECEDGAPTCYFHWYGNPSSSFLKPFSETLPLLFILKKPLQHV